MPGQLDVGERHVCPIIILHREHMYNVHTSTLAVHVHLKGMISTLVLTCTQCNEPHKSHMAYKTCTSLLRSECRGMPSDELQ